MGNLTDAILVLALGFLYLLYVHEYAEYYFQQFNNRRKKELAEKTKQNC